MPLTPGARLGQYELEHHLGAGGMGVVHRAFDTRLERPVAIKLLHPSTEFDSSRRLLLESIFPLAATNAALSWPTKRASSHAGSVSLRLS